MNIVVIDYGVGNLHSVLGAFGQIGVEPLVTSDFDALERADGLVLPGVGAFPDAMDNLNLSGIADYLRSSLNGRPLLGICLGMQLLFEKSSEFCETNGLGLLPGEVVKLTAYERSEEFKIPHMGWNSLEFTENGRKSVLFDGIESGAFVYFVHSYMAKTPTALATTDYGEQITAAAGEGNIFGLQFHPEKSADVGMRMLKNFCSLMD